MSNERTYPTLDLLRVDAITMTILAHVTSVTYSVPLLRDLKYGMWLGVDLFMLISGWLLGGQLLRDTAKGRGPWRFYFKRWMRTLPPYYVMLALLYVGQTGGMETASPSDLALHFVFAQQYAGDNHYFVSWSLCVEEHFYLLLPLVIAAIRRVDRAWFVLAIVIAIEVIAVIGRVIAFPTDREGIPMVTHLRWHGLFLGLFFAYLAHTKSRWWNAIGRAAPYLGPIGIVATLAVMASIPAPPNRWMFVGVPTVGTWTLALVFLACVHPRCRWSRVSFPGLVYLGELTYSLYLVHAVIPKSWLGAHGALLGFAIRFGLMIGCAIALHEVIERPALWLRKKALERWR